MTNVSVTATPLSHNDVFVLARLFEVSFHYFRTHSSPNVTDFILDLRTIAGLGLTASLADDGGIMPYQMYFNRFIHAGRGDFREDDQSTSLGANTMANMVMMGLSSFRRLNYPDYYASFISRVEKTIQNVRIDLADETENAERMVRLFPYPLR